MPSKYVTLRQDAPGFKDYLWGHQENGCRAVPVKTYNVGTPEESVTFEMRPMAEIRKPGFFVFLSAIVKLKSFILILLPLFYVLTQNQLQNQLNDPLGGGLAAVAMIFLFAGLNMRNDMNDHISGYDRVNLDASVKPVRQGWVTAKQLSRWSLISIFMAALVAVPLVLLHPELLKVLGLALVLFFLGRFSQRNSYKHQHFGEFVLLMLMGPALVSGYQISMGVGIDFKLLSFGAIWGCAVLFLVQVNNFSHIMTSSQSGIKNSMTKLGFDLSQKFLIIEWFSIIFAWMVFHAFFFHWIWTLTGSVFLAAGALPLYRQLSNIKSPMGSSLQLIRKQASRSFMVLVVIVVAENLGLLCLN